ncbi:ABC transporter permease [Acidobacteriota bacterium]
MFKNYIKIVVRNLKRHKVYSFINIFGLSIGMACCILILLYVSHELSYDNYHENGERIYRVHSISSIGSTTRSYSTIPPVIAPELAASIPEIESAVRNFDSFGFQGRIGEETVDIEDVFWVDPNYFDLFSHEFILGDAKSAFQNPDSLLLTEETAVRIFGKENPIGKAISLGPDRSIQVTAVIENVPQNSHFQFNGLIPSSFFRDREGNPGGILTADYFCQVFGYFLLNKDADPREVEKKMADETEARWGELYRQRGTRRTYLLQKLSDIHLRSDFDLDLGINGSISNVYLFMGIAILVLLIACFNFINLSTARSSSRAREVGMRKVLGSQKIQLVKQFLSESIVISIVSLILSLLIVITVLPAFNSLSGKEFEINQLLQLPILIGIFVIVVITGIIAGSFPAFILSAFNPITVLKGKLSSASKNSGMRKVLVIVQFSISIFMIVGIFTMVRQLEFMKNKDLGFDKEQLAVINFFGSRRDEAQAQRFDSMREQILQEPGVVSVTFSGNVPGRDLGFDAYLPEGSGNEDTVRARNYWVGYDFLETYGIELLHGRDFSRQYSTDAGQAVLMNETAAKSFGWGEDAIGKRIINVARDNRLGVVVGIYKDFHNENMKLKISPTILSLEPEFFGFVTVKLRPENISRTLVSLEKLLGDVSRSIRPERAFNFDYYFIDDDFRSKYPQEDKVREIYLTFGLFAILIACLGLFGLASFTLEQRTKEIGVRKVLGASLQSIGLLLSKEFTKLVLISNILAWPLAFYIMQRWLGNFAYRIDMTVDIFILSGVITALIALFTICFHSFKAALSNPIDSLRYE